MKLVSIPREKYEDYRLDAIFNCYKWDPQFFDNNTVAKHALVLSKEEHEEIENLTEKLTKETILAEEFLNQNLHLLKPLALPKKILKELKNMNNYKSDRNIRLMRFDFHLTEEEKWAVSLDKNRTNRFKMDSSVFDNSWDIYDQDMPSAEYFLKNGIKKIIVRGASIQKDLRVILYKFQKKGIQIFFTNGYEKPSRMIIRRFFCQNIL